MTIETYDDLKHYVGSKDDFTDDLLNMGYTKGKKDGRAEVIEEIKQMCGAKKPCYADCDSCRFAYFEDDFETTTCKIEQLKEQNK